jgi:hypothetical protein
MKNHAGAGNWLLLLTLVAACAWACGDDDDDAPNGVAGSGGKAQGGTAGKDGTAGKGGAGASGAAGASGGTGGADAGAAGFGGACQADRDCPAVDYCGPFPLDELCQGQSGACPHFDELDYTELCRDGTTVTLHDTTCGGKVVVADYGLGTDTWGFNADGVLIYKRFDSDAFDVCPDGKGASASTVWGKLECSVSGGATDFCGAGGAGGGGGEGGGGHAGGAGSEP